jgi:RNA polymerase sigma-70 factor (family 1)
VLERSLLHSDFKKDEIQLLINGDRFLFEKIFHTYHRAVYAIALRYLKDSAMAQDVVQEVFTKLWNHRASLNPDQPLKGYLFTIAKNHILNTIRNNAKAKERILDYFNDRPVNLMEDSSSDLQESIYRAIQLLPKKRRIIFKLKHFKGLDNQAVAAKMHLSVNTVKVQYTKALKFLRSQF